MIFYFASHDFELDEIFLSLEQLLELLPTQHLDLRLELSHAALSLVHYRIERSHVRDFRLELSHAASSLVHDRLERSHVRHVRLDLSHAALSLVHYRIERSHAGKTESIRK